MASHIEMATMVHDFLTILSHQCLFLRDIKHGYYAVNVYLDDCYFLAFHIPRIG